MTKKLLHFKLKILQSNLLNTQTLQQKTCVILTLPGMP